MPEKPALRPRLFGLTGGIGSGKTVVAGMLQARGIPVFDADETARALTRPGGSAVAAVAAAFGPPVAREDGTLDRAALARLVFADPQARLKLEGVLHPRIDAAARTWLAERAAEGCAVAFIAAPLLFEADRDAGLEAVVVVVAGESLRVRRVTARDGADAEAVRARMAAQVGDAERLLRADHVLHNDGTLDELQREVDELLGRIL